MAEDWGGDSYWGNPQDSQDNQQELQRQTPQGIPGMPPAASSQAPFNVQAGQGFPQDNSQPFQQGIQQGGAPQSQTQGIQQDGASQTQGIPQNNAAIPQQESPKSDAKPFIMIFVILIVIALVSGGVYLYQRGLKEKNTASITTSQQAQTNNRSQSKPSGKRSSQGGMGTPSEKEGSTKESPNTSWDSAKDESGKTDDVHGLSEVGSLPDVSSRGSSGAIVASKHVYVLDKGYVYSLELSLSTGNSNSVEFFVSKDNFDKINTGTIVSVEYVKYSDGRVGITSINSNGNSSEK